VAIAAFVKMPSGSSEDFNPENLEVFYLNVTGSSNITETSIENAWVDVLDSGSIESTNVITNHIESTSGTIETLETTHLESETATIGTLTGTNATFETIMTNIVCTSDVLAHTESGEIPPTHAIQTIQGSPQTIMNELPLGIIPTGNTVTANGVTFRADSSMPWEVLQLPNNPSYRSQSDPIGTTVIFGGIPEDFAGGGGIEANPNPFFDDSFNDLTIFLDNPVPGQVYTYNVKLRYSTEPGFDFIRVYKNYDFGTIIESFEGNTNNAADGYSVATFQITLQDSELYTISFEKDDIWYGGYDAFYVFLEQPLPSQMTLPEDLTPYIGKTIKVCSSDGQRNTVEMQGANTIDSNCQFKVIRFEEEEGCQCCVDITGIDSNSVSVQRDAGCSVYCVTSEQLHCIDPERPSETNPFHGWWRAAAKNDRDPVPYFEMDMTTVPGQYRNAAHGTVNNPMTPALSQGNPGVAVDQDFSVYAFNQRTVTLTQTFGDLSGTAAISFTLQDDGETLARWIALDQAAGLWINRLGIYKKTTVEQVPAYCNEANALTEPMERNDDYPVGYLLGAMDRSLTTWFAVTNPNANTDQFIGNAQARALMNEIINTGITHTTPIVAVQPTQSYDPITVIVTDVQNFVMTPAVVTIEGFTGDYAALNGRHMPIVYGQDGFTIDPEFQDHSATDWTKTSYPSSFWLGIDTSDVGLFPRDAMGNANFTGTPTVTVSYGPIDDASEYAMATSSYMYWTARTFGTALHQGITILTDQSFTSRRFAWIYKPYETFNEIVNSADLDVTFRGVRSIMDIDYSLLFGQVQDAIYLNIRLGISGFRFRPPQNPNNRLKVTTLQATGHSYDQTHAYDLQIDNYLTNVKNLFVRCTGNTKTHPNNLAYAAIFGTAGCDTLETMLLDISDPPPASPWTLYHEEIPTNGLNGDPLYSTYTNDDYKALKVQFYIGQVDPALTDGKVIGVIRVPDTQFNSPVISYNLYEQFGDPAFDDPLSPLRFSGMVIDVFQAIFTYLVDTLGCDDIIFDNRHNLGGSVTSTYWRNFVGGTDERVFNAAMRQPNDIYSNAPYVDMSTGMVIENPDMYEARQALMDVWPSLVKERYPNSVFTGGKYVMLTSHQAASGGDLNPMAFMGPNLDGDLGNNTEYYVIGDIDGRLYGSSEGRPQQCNRGVYRRFFGQGPGVEEWNWNSYESANSRTFGANGQGLASRPDILKPVCAPTLRGNSGGCPLPTDFEYVYKLLGLTPTPYARLPGDARPTRPTTAVSTTPLTVAGSPASTTVTATSNADHGFTTGDVITVASVAVDTERIRIEDLNKEFEVTVTGASTFTIDVPVPETSVDATTPDGGGLTLTLTIPADTYTVEVTTDSAHGMTSGDKRALIGSPVRIIDILASTLNAAHSITVTGLDEFTFDATNTYVVNSDTIFFTDRTEWRDGWLEQAIESVFDGETYQLTDKLATVSASDIVTIDLGAVHGLNIGDEITLTNVAADVEGIPMDELNKQHLVSTVVSPSIIEIQVVTPATGTNAATGGDFFIRHRAGAKKKRTEPRNVPKQIYFPAKKHNVKRSNGMEHYGKDITCTEAMGALTPVGDMPKRYVIHYNNTNNLPPRIRRINPERHVGPDNTVEVFQKLHKLIRSEVMSGGLCMHPEQGLMATSKCKYLPIIAMSEGHGRQVMPEGAYDPDARHPPHISK
jgi:hypothetical protein